MLGSQLSSPLDHKAPQVPRLPPLLREGAGGSPGLRPVDFVDKLRYQVERAADPAKRGDKQF